MFHEMRICREIVVMTMLKDEHCVRLQKVGLKDKRRERREVF